MKDAVEVAIGIVVRDGKVLIARRPAAARLGGYWEFPGGKRHEGESAEQCVVRELREEVALSVRPVRALSIIEYEYEHGAVRLYPFICAIVSGGARAIWADELVWSTPGELSKYGFPPANDALIRQLPHVLAELKLL